MSSIESEIYARLSGGMVTTPFSIEVLDAAGKKATGYLAGVGAGETVTDMITGDSSTFTSSVGDWIPEGTGTITAAGGKGILTPVAPYNGMIYSPAISISGQLNKMSLKHRLQSGTAQLMQIRTPPIQCYDFTPTGTETQSPSIYKIGDAYTQMRITDAGFGGNGVYEIDDIIFQKVLDPPATACHIVSSLNGTTRNWASVESGFDPNTITSWKVYDIATPGFYLPGVGTFNRGDFTAGNAFFWSSIDLSPYQGRLITAATGVTALVGEKIYPLTIPQHADLPAVTYMKVSDISEHCMGGDSPIKTIRMQVDCWAETFPSMTEVEAQVIACLSRYRGGNILDCFLDSSMHFFDNDTFHSAIDFQVFFSG